MRILFVGGMYPKEYEDYFKNNLKTSGFQPAANTFQWSIIQGLCDNNVRFDVISFPFLASYPRNKQLYPPCGDIRMDDGEKIGEVKTYNTFFLIKDLSKQYRLKRAVGKWLKKNYSAEEKTVIMTYTPSSCFVYALIPFKKRYKRLNICSIIADLVDDSTNPVFKLSFPKYLQARIEQKLVWNSYKHIDKYVLLTQAMSEKISYSTNNHVIVEGVSGRIPETEIQIKHPLYNTLLYTGAIQKFTGILDLVRSFKATSNPNYRLIICGGGDCQDLLLTLIADDDRIEYKGMLSREEVLKLQMCSTALINPRKPNVSLTKYSFPSKTMEYLASGTPMIGYQLEGIPSEYYPHFYTPINLSDEALTECIESVLSAKPEQLQLKGMNARNFIKENKNAKIQVAKILKYLEL